MKKLMIITSLLIALIVSLPITLAATQNLIYDANGNLVTGDSKYREYDGFNHLVKIRDGNNATGIILEDYVWDPLEEKIGIKNVYLANGSWVETVYYVSKEFVRVTNASGNFDYKYIYQNGRLIAQELVGGPKHFMLNDHKGTVSVVVNESGSKVEETFYSPFGEIISGGATSRFSYEGKEFDSVVGDYDYHARKANLGWGLFTQPDTLLPNVYDPQQLNRYAFERNNPYKYEDKDGNTIAIATMLVGFVIGTISYSMQHRGEANSLDGLAYHLSKAVIHGGIGAATGLATGLTMGGGGHIAAQTTGRLATRVGIGAAGSIANNLFEGEDIDYLSAIFSGLTEIIPIAGSKPGTFYSPRSLTKNSYITGLQYGAGSLIGMAPMAFLNLYNYFKQSYNVNDQQQIANQASQSYTKAENKASEIAGSSGGSSSGYNWGVEQVGNTLQVIVVIPGED